MNPEGCIEGVKKGDVEQRTNTVGQRRKTASEIVTTGLCAAVGREDDVRSDMRPGMGPWRGIQEWAVAAASREA
jgi:hypothetical protein